MKITVPVGYNAKVKAPRKVNAVLEFFFEWKDIEIQDVSDEDAPIAAQWKDDRAFLKEHLAFHDFRTYQQTRLVADDGTDHTRWYNGAHWWPVLSRLDYNDYESSAYRVDAQKFQKQWTEEFSGYPMPRTDIRGYIIEENPAGKPLDYDYYRSVTENTFEHEYQKLIDASSNFIFVNGMLYQRLAEPVYTISYFSKLDSDDKSEVQRLIRVLPNDPAFTHVTTDVYSLEQADEVIGRSKLNRSLLKRGEQRDSDTPSINRDRIAQVFIPQSLKTDLDTQKILIIADKIIENNGDRKISKFSRDEGICFLNFVQAADTLRDIGELDPLHQATEEYKMCNVDHSTRQRLEGILELINLRPISVSSYR